jgi:hypothetical protein
MAWELRQLGEEVGRLNPIEPKPAMRGTGSTGEWRFTIGKQRWSWIGVAEHERSRRAVAGYYPRWRTGGTIAFEDDESYLLRGSVVRTTWHLRTPERASVARLLTGNPGGMVERIVPADAAAQVRDLSLLLLFAIWAIVIEPSFIPMESS